VRTTLPTTALDVRQHCVRREVSKGTVGLLLMPVKETRCPCKSVPPLLDSYGLTNVARNSFNMLVEAIGHIAVQVFDHFS